MLKNNLAVEKGAALFKMASEKVMKSKGAAKKWLHKSRLYLLLELLLKQQVIATNATILLFLRILFPYLTIVRRFLRIDILRDTGAIQSLLVDGVYSYQTAQLLVLCRFRALA